MKVLFVCSSLEEGFDGVGDYTRKLASELLKNGIRVYLIALNDKYLVKQKEEAPNTLRLSNKQPWHWRISAVKNVIHAWNPDIISLQFVPYGFNSKGLPWLLPRRIKSIRQNKPLHICFHELWIGSVDSLDFKSHLIAIGQAFIIKRLASQADRIHVSLPIFQNMLNRIGIGSLRLQIPSSIARVNGPDLPPHSITGSLRVALFSCKQPTQEMVNALRILQQDCKNKSIHFELHHIGGLTPAERATFTGHLHGQQIIFHGWLSEMNVSKVLTSCHAAITHYPRHALGKGSTISAFLLHGLPILVPNKGISGCSPFHFKDVESAIVISPSVDSINYALSSSDFSVISELFTPFAVADRFVRDISSLIDLNPND